MNLDYHYTNRKKRASKLLLYLIKNGNMVVCQEDFELNQIE